MLRKKKNRVYFKNDFNKVSVKNDFIAKNLQCPDSGMSIEKSMIWSAKTSNYVLCDLHWKISRKLN